MDCECPVFGSFSYPRQHLYIVLCDHDPEPFRNLSSIANSLNFSIAVMPEMMLFTSREIEKLENAE